jgi:uncharacterized protein involved in exopolysaccharide biosynthesis
MSSTTRSKLRRAKGQESFTIVEILGILWDSKVLIGICTIFGLVFATCVAIVLPKKYNASVLVSPVSGSGGSGGLRSVLGNLSGLASIAGVNISHGAKTAIEVATLKSTELTEKYINKNDLLPILFANRWDKVSKRWDQGVKIPSLWEGSKYFSEKIREVAENPKTGLVTLQITWTDPRLAEIWANGLVKLANESLRDREIRRATRDIEYLKSQAEATHNIALREDIYTLMMRVLQREMIAQGENEYAFRIIDPAVIAEKPSSPKVVLWALMGLFLGCSLSSCYVVLRSSWSRQLGE